ncbi:E3 ubiquitin-protein ligase PUB24 [Sesamum alatum]|uniref:U-box domain-containing protein n=1 Tax=Sesamum alatum TaxID=300844 RepID=A0AAE2CSJ5_9LAMI|nr:E3 ubiquitin-protein ligase PUB24 [Sesamum alatum]
MENTEVPEYFICPISLQIMKDPVTAVSGITYDRESIENWLFKSHNTICPVTKQALSTDSGLTPNHTLRRLIQAWCSLNAAQGVELIPSPDPPLTRIRVASLIRDLYLPNFRIKTLRKLEALALESERSRVYLVEAGLAKAVASLIVSRYKTGERNGLEEALRLLYTVRVPLSQSRGPVTENGEIIDSLMWVFGCDNKVVKSHAAFALKVVVQKANPGMLERLKPEFFRSILHHLREAGIRSQLETNSLLHVLLEACLWGRNRAAMVESGAVFHLIEVELRGPEKKTTELVLGILYHLCSSADGRAQLLSHAAGVAVVSRRILKVSPTADDRAVLIIGLISKYSGTSGVVQEMLRVGSVAKLCTVMQANCASYLKEKAREILRAHSDVWKDSPCVEVPTLTRQSRRWRRWVSTVADGLQRWASMVAEWWRMGFNGGGVVADGLQ